jgi:ABC-type phosphate transport system substrate-binding protein
MLGRRSILAALATFLLWAGGAAAQNLGFVVVIHAGNPTATLSRQEISRMFLKQRARWDHGERVRPVDLTETKSVREQFSLAIFRRRTIDIEDHWKSQVFSGRDVPPTEKASEPEVLDYVAANPGAIGYVSPGTALPPGVKAIEIVD